MTNSPTSIAKMSLRDLVRTAIAAEPRFRRAFAAAPTLHAFEMIRVAETKGLTNASLHWFVPFSIAARVAGDAVALRREDPAIVAASLGVEPDDLDTLLAYYDIAMQAQRSVGVSG